jgi:CRISPR-associated protein Csd1
LNHLLSKDSRQRLQVGDATVVFWAERASGAAAEEAFRDWFDVPPDDPDRRTERVRALIELRQGRPLTGDDEQRFYVLGLAPNAARIAVRFWQVATIRELGDRAFAHFEALKIDRGGRDEEFPTLTSLLRALAVQGKIENVQPNLAGEWMRAILAGAPYPVTLLQSALRRARAEQGVGYRRAAVIKACLHRMSGSKEENPTVSLDNQNPNAAYRLGRLFAVLERIQEEANPGLNATIRDRYFGAASSSPRMVFPVLNRLKNHHLAKLDNRGRAVNLERLVGEIVDGLDASDPFPASLSLADQGRFAVGYYHQRQHPMTYRTGGND